MGQQQLLITILVTIIIGVVIVIAINTMQASRAAANKSYLRQDMLMVLNDAQIYYRKARMMGGGGNSFNGISSDDIYSIDPKNQNGSYKISGSGDSVTVNGISNVDGTTLTAKAAMSTNGMEISWSEPS